MKTPEPIKDAEAQDVLLALGGMVCTGCNQDLNWKKKQYYCNKCDLAHCPYCCRSMTARCPHRFAHREWGRWQFKGVAGPTCKVPHAPLAAHLLLDYSHQQKLAVFGNAYPLVRDLYGQGFAHPPTAAILTEALIKQFGLPESEQDGGGTRYGKYFFVRDPDAARARAKAALQSLRDGFDTLARKIPPSARYVHRVLSPPEGCKADTLSPFLSFAPGGAPWIARNYDAQVVIWHRENDLPPMQLCCGLDQVVGATFSPDGEQIAVHSQRTIDWNDSRCTISLWEVRTGRLLLKHETSAPPQTSHGANGLQCFLHNGKSVALLRDNVVHVVPVSHCASGNRVPSLTTQGDPLPGIRLQHRITVDQMAVAPDGTLATTQGDHVLLWNISEDAMKISLNVETSSMLSGEAHKSIG